MRTALLLVILALGPVGCLGSDFADSLEGQWQFTSGSIDGRDLEPIDSHPVTILFEKGEVGGTAACNHYGGSYQLSGSAISFSAMSMTEMACFPPEAMELEATYMEALSRVDQVTIDQALVLSGSGVELSFEVVEPVDDAELTNTVWVLDSLITGDAVSTVLGDRATLELFGDGSMQGGTGCRSFSGRYEIRGGEVAVTELASDGHECPPDLADQDSHVLTVLGDSFRPEVDGDTLTVWSPGNLALVYRAEG